MSTYILTDDKTKCLSKSSTLSNCLTAKSSNNTHCHTCDVGYSLVSNACSKGNISHCSTY